MIKKLSPKDFESIFSFKKWISEALPRLDRADIGKPTLLICLEYIRELVLSNSALPQKEWLILIRDLETRIQKHETA
jgi:hypothetical protein